MSLSSVATIIHDYYKVSNDSINWLAMIFSAMYVTVVAAVAILNKWGLRVTIVTGALCNAVARYILLFYFIMFFIILSFILSNVFLFIIILFIDYIFIYLSLTNFLHFLIKTS